MLEGAFKARLAYVPASGLNERLYGWDTPEVASLERAQEDALDAVNGHDYANRIHIVTGVKDPYDGVVHEEIMEEFDVVRG